MHLKNTATLLLLIISSVSCKKYLDKKPSTTLKTPSSLVDLQALLDNNSVINQSGPDLQELISDDYYVTTTDYQSCPEIERLNYIWDKSATFLSSYIAPYKKAVYYSNIVLDQLPVISQSTGNTSSSANVKGSALFYRSFAFFTIAQLYCKPYSMSASSDPGIVLRLTSAIEDNPERSTVQQTYDQITGDLKEASVLLPPTATYPTRPSKTAVFALLARTYLTMGDYVNAGKYADSCLHITGDLMDFNSLTPGYIEHFNPETIFYNITETVSSIIYPPIARVDSLLYQSFSSNDLRKSIFFGDNGDGTYYFQGAYDADFWQSCIFNGIATDEIYLIRAECNARANDIPKAMADVNTLLSKRWLNGSFTPITVNTADEALSLILTERRKELLFRGLRWSDIRRLNVAGTNITLTRQIAGNTYTLPPNDPRTVMLIPLEIISASHITQNPR